MPHVRARGAAACFAVGSMSLAMGMAAPTAIAPGSAAEPAANPLSMTWTGLPDTTVPAGAQAFDAATLPTAVGAGSGTGRLDAEAAVIRRTLGRVGVNRWHHGRVRGPAPARHRPAASRAARRPAIGSDPRSVASRLVAGYGWSSTQFHCLDLLWTRESGWQVHETNPTSGAYGIPQALPADKLARFGADWRDSAITQIRWGLWYIAGRYGTPCAAWAHSEAYDYY